MTYQPTDIYEEYQELLIQGDACLEQGNKSEARRCFQRAVQLLPEEPPAWFLLASVSEGAAREEYLHTGERLRDTTENVERLTFNNSNPTLLHPEELATQSESPIEIQPATSTEPEATPPPIPRPSFRASPWFIPIIIGLLLLYILAAILAIWYINTPRSKEPLSLPSEAAPHQATALFVLSNDLATPGAGYDPQIWTVINAPDYRPRSPGRVSRTNPPTWSISSDPYAPDVLEANPDGDIFSII